MHEASVTASEELRELEDRLNGVNRASKRGVSYPEGEYQRVAFRKLLSKRMDRLEFDKELSNEEKQALAVGIEGLRDAIHCLDKVK